MTAVTTTSLAVDSASAGSGKTFRITDVIRDAILGGLRAEEVLATTFTKKAAAELVERTRAKLLDSPDAVARDEAIFLEDALIGTVNSVCGRLLEDFALEAGLPPKVRVLSEQDQPLVFERALGEVLGAHGPALEPLAERLSATSEQMGKFPGATKEWRAVVGEMVSLARANGIDPAGLPACADRSVQGLLALLPPSVAEAEGERVDADLAAAVEACLEAVAKGADTTDKTAKAVERVRAARATLHSGDQLPWLRWLQLSKLAPGKKSADAFHPVIELAAGFERHPRFRRDLEEFVRGCFACAADALGAYQDYKRAEGLIDFVDQEALVLRLLRDSPRFRDAMRERLKLLVVDEFQDTSPIQLAVFMALLDNVGRGHWVGDQKQAIYGFRGTDPELMEAVLVGMGGKSSILGDSRRSRPALVHLANAMFVPAFGALGVPEAEVRLTPVRADPAGASAPLRFLTVGGGKQEEHAAATAAGLVDLLAAPGDFVVEDPATKSARPLRPGDVAVLCRTGKWAALVARELSARGVRVAFAWPGLLAAAETRLAMAGLRYLISERDTLAVAEILHLTSGGGTGWLSDWYADRVNPFWKDDERIRALDAVRVRLIGMTPREALDVAVAAARVAESVHGWGGVDQRVANLDALRALALAYEDNCLISRSAATPQGLAQFLETAAGDEKVDRQPEATGNDAVTVSTYHGSKGLEWPLVVMTEVATTKERGPFDLVAEPCDDGFDPREPLAGRWIRFWPWPFLGNSKGIGMLDRAAETDTARRAAERSRREELRLLYVGVTRARDYLIVASPGGKTGWLEIAQPGAPWPAAAPGEGVLACDGHDVLWTCRAISDVGQSAGAAQTVHRPRLAFGPAPDFPPARLAPSSLIGAATGEPPPTEVVRLGSRLTVRREDEYNLLGCALHDFLAVDDPARAREERLGVAKRLMAGWTVGGAMDPEDWLAASERLRQFLGARYGHCTLCREWPIHLRRPDGQEANGSIDLLVEVQGSRGWAVVDHKSFPGTEKDAVARCAEYWPQLELYKEAVETATGLPVVDLVVHLPILGIAVRRI